MAEWKPARRRSSRLRAVLGNLEGAGQAGGGRMPLQGKVKRLAEVVSWRVFRPDAWLALHLGPCQVGLGGGVHARQAGGLVSDVEATRCSLRQ